jgi:hypothetical protein
VDNQKQKPGTYELSKHPSYCEEHRAACRDKEKSTSTLVQAHGSNSLDSRAIMNRKSNIELAGLRDPQGC